MDNLTPNDFAKSLDVACESYEASGLAREDIISELEAKLFELRGESDPIAFAPLP